MVCVCVMEALVGVGRCRHAGPEKCIVEVAIGRRGGTRTETMSSSYSPRARQFSFFLFLLFFVAVFDVAPSAFDEPTTTCFPPCWFRHSSSMPSPCLPIALIALAPLQTHHSVNYSIRGQIFAPAASSTCCFNDIPTLTQAYSLSLSAVFSMLPSGSSIRIRTNDTWANRKNNNERSDVMKLNRCAGYVRLDFAPRICP